MYGHYQIEHVKNVDSSIINSCQLNIPGSRYVFQSVPLLDIIKQVLGHKYGLSNLVYSFLMRCDVLIICEHVVRSVPLEASFSRFEILVASQRLFPSVCMETVKLMSNT